MSLQETVVTTIEHVTLLKAALGQQLLSNQVELAASKTQGEMLLRASERQTKAMRAQLSQRCDAASAEVRSLEARVLGFAMEAAEQRAGADEALARASIEGRLFVEAAEEEHHQMQAQLSEHRVEVFRLEAGLAEQLARGNELEARLEQRRMGADEARIEAARRLVVAEVERSELREAIVAYEARATLLAAADVDQRRAAEAVANEAEAVALEAAAEQLRLVQTHEAAAAEQRNAIARVQAELEAHRWQADDALSKAVAEGARRLSASEATCRLFEDRGQRAEESLISEEARAGTQIAALTADMVGLEFLAEVVASEGARRFQAEVGELNESISRAAGCIAGLEQQVDDAHEEAKQATRKARTDEERRLTADVWHREEQAELRRWCEGLETELSARHALSEELQEQLAHSRTASAIESAKAASQISALDASLREFVYAIEEVGHERVVMREKLEATVDHLRLQGRGREAGAEQAEQAEALLKAAAEVRLLKGELLDVSAQVAAERKVAAQQSAEMAAERGAAAAKIADLSLLMAEQGRTKAEQSRMQRAETADVARHGAQLVLACEEQIRELQAELAHVHATFSAEDACARTRVGELEEHLRCQRSASESVLAGVRAEASRCLRASEAQGREWQLSLARQRRTASVACDALKHATKEISRMDASLERSWPSELGWR